MKITPDNLGRYASDGRFAVAFVKGIPAEGCSRPSSFQLTQAIKRYERALGWVPCVSP